MTFIGKSSLLSSTNRSWLSEFFHSYVKTPQWIPLSSHSYSLFRYHKFEVAVLNNHSLSHSYSQKIDISTHKQLRIHHGIEKPFGDTLTMLWKLKINYFDWAIFKFANCKRLPEGTIHPIHIHYFDISIINSKFHTMEFQPFWDTSGTGSPENHWPEQSTFILPNMLPELRLLPFAWKWPVSDEVV